MRHQIFFVSFMLIVLHISQYPAYSDSMPAYQDRSVVLERAIKRAKVIVVARITGSKPIVWSTPHQQSGSTQEIEVNTTGMPSSSLCSLEVIQVVKGQSPQKIHVAFQYPPVFINFSKKQMRGGNALLLFLDNSQGKWHPVEPLLPYSHIIFKAEVSKGSGKKANPRSAIIGYMLASLPDQFLRESKMQALRSIKDSRISGILRKYIEDTNMTVRSNALHSLAFNQQVDIIPRIVQMEESQKTGTGIYATALSKFKTEKAIPYLNSLIFSPNEAVRSGAVEALRDLADKTSIPYLILALSDPDPQDYIPYVAYDTLHRLIPKLGEAGDTPYFLSHREAETRLIYKWWSAELQGQHHPSLTEANLSGASKTENSKLYTLLFHPSTKTRQKVLLRLKEIADKSSIPYYVLAVRDPDIEIAYGAYKILHEFIPELGQVENESVFKERRSTTIKPVINWWQKYLSASQALTFPSRTSLNVN